MAKTLDITGTDQNADWIKLVDPKATALDRKASQEAGRLKKGGPGSGNFGHGGRLGQVGGSSSGGGGEGRTKPSATPKAPPAKHSDFQSAGKKLAEKLKRAGEGGGVHARSTSGEIRGVFAQSLKEDGFTDDEISGFRSATIAWQGSSDSPGATMMEAIMAKRNGGTIFHHGKEIAPDDEAVQSAKQYFNLNYSLSAKRFEEIADRHQAFQQGIARELYGDKVSLYRGILTDQEFQPGRTAQVDMNSISSWTTDKDVANDFAKGTFGESGKPHGYVMAIDLPIERLFSTPFGGFGKADENEFLPEGGKNKTVEIVSSYNLRAGTFRE